jgi:hypothetical protein
MVILNHRLVINLLNLHRLITYYLIYLYRFNQVFKFVKVISMNLLLLYHEVFNLDQGLSMRLRRLLVILIMLIFLFIFILFSSSMYLRKDYF